MTLRPALAALALLVAGCSSSGGASPTPINPPASITTCPAPSVARAVLPAAVPAGFPTPPTAVLTAQEIRMGVTYVHFTTTMTLRDGVIYLVSGLRRAGYVLGRGDAELNEADAPFTGPTIVGALRLTRVQRCQTDWILAVAPRAAQVGGTPFSPQTLLPHSPGPSASPLPFG